jgi:hypothetical protein
MASNVHALGNQSQAVNDVQNGYNDAVRLARGFFPATLPQSQFCAGYTAGYNASNLCQPGPNPLSN